MSDEALIAAGYAALLVLGAFVLEWLSAHTHRRSLRYHTAGFTYHTDLDHWECPQGERLWPHEYDHQRRLVRYRANAHACNVCPLKERCTDSDHGREIVRPVDPWPHSEAGRFHRVIALLMVALGALVTLTAGARNHSAGEAAVLGAVLLTALASGRWLARDLHTHPANFPAPSPSHGLHMTLTDAEADAAPTGWPWASGGPTDGTR
jgi:hypothetical protein